MTRTDARARDERALTEAVEEMSRAWNAGDARAYGACFAEDATYTTWVGTTYVGREEITSSHAALFETFLRGSRMRAEVTHTRFFGSDVAVLTTRGDVAKGRGPGRLTKAQTFTMVRQGQRWLAASFHNTKRRPLMEALSFRMEPRTAPVPVR